MSVGNRKVMYIDGEEVDTEQDSIEFDLGGLEGEAVMADNRFAGTSKKTKPGMAKAKVVLNGKLKKEWWDPNVTRDVEIDVPELGRVAVFATMEQIKTFTSSGKSVEIEFVGPVGAYS